VIAFGLLHVLLSTLAGYAAAVLGGGLTAWSAALSLGVGALGAAILRREIDGAAAAPRVFSLSPGASGVIEGLLLTFLLVAAWRHFGWMLYAVDGSLRTLSLNNYGDLPLHVNFIRFFAGGAPFPPLNPIFPSEPLFYPLGMDLYSALWESIGVPTASHLFIAGMFCFVASIQLLRAWGGWLAVGGFFLNGGLLGFELLRGASPTADAEQALAWKNLLLTVFITQRGVLFALPAGVLLIHVARQSLRGEVTLSGTQRRLFGLLWGAMALFHLHAFLIVSLILVGLAVIHGDRRHLPLARTVLGWAVPLGAACVLYSTQWLSKGAVAHWRWGWMSGTDGVAAFLIANFGFWIPAIGAALVVLARRRSRGDVLEWLLALGLFALFLNLMMAPWDWDNIKILMWPYVLWLGVSWRALAALSPAVRRVVEPACAVVLLLSGATMVVRTFDDAPQAPSLVTLSAYAKTAGAVGTVPRSAVFAAAQTPDHALAWLGRARALGYEGHLWSHGVNSAAATRDLRALYGGRDDWRAAAARLRVTHVFWGPQEATMFGQLSAAVRGASRQISPVPGYEVYELPRQDRVQR
jgi:hypothetical protein